MTEFIALFCLFLMVSGGLAWVMFFCTFIYIWLTGKGKV